MGTLQLLNLSLSGHSRGFVNQQLDFKHKKLQDGSVEAMNAQVTSQATLKQLMNDLCPNATTFRETMTCLEVKSKLTMKELNDASEDAGGLVVPCPRGMADCEKDNSGGKGCSIL